MRQLIAPLVVAAVFATSAEAKVNIGGTAYGLMMDANRLCTLLSKVAPPRYQQNKRQRHAIRKSSHLQMASAYLVSSAEWGLTKQKAKFIIHRLKGHLQGVKRAKGSLFRGKNSVRVQAIKYQVVMLVQQIQETIDDLEYQTAYL